MRLVLLLIAVALLAVPATALASSTSSASATQFAAKKKPKPAKKSKKLRKTTKTSSSTTRSGATPRTHEQEAEGPIIALVPLTVGTLACEVPTALSTTGFTVGDIVEIKCDLVNGVLTLRRLERKGDAPATSPGAPAGEVEVKGAIVSLNPLQVGSTVCAVPDGMSLAGFDVGQTVEVACSLVGGILTVRKLKHDDGDDENGDDNASSANTGSSTAGPGGGGDDDHSGSGQGGGNHSGSGGNND